MLMRALIAVVVWVVVAVVLELIGKAVGSDIGAFLVQNNVLIGFLAGVLYFFFGDNVNRR